MNSFSYIDSSSLTNKKLRIDKKDIVNENNNTIAEFIANNPNTLFINNVDNQIPIIQEIDMLASVIKNALISSIEEYLSSEKKHDDVPIWEKSNLTLQEASKYSGIGINKLRELSDDDNCEFVLWVGSKRLIKRQLFDEYIKKEFSI